VIENYRKSMKNWRNFKYIREIQLTWACFCKRMRWISQTLKNWESLNRICSLIWKRKWCEIKESLLCSSLFLPTFCWFTFLIMFSCVFLRHNGWGIEQLLLVWWHNWGHWSHFSNLWKFWLGLLYFYVFLPFSSLLLIWSIALIFFSVLFHIRNYW